MKNILFKINTTTMILLMTLFLSACDDEVQYTPYEDMLIMLDENTIDELYTDELDGDENEDEDEDEDEDEIIITNTSGFYMPSLSIDDLASRATYIVRAEILDGRVMYKDLNRPGSTFPPHYRITTANRILVLEVIKGDVEIGDIMEVFQEGGQYGNRKLVNNRQVMFNIGDDLVLFLNQFGFLPHPDQTIYHFPPIESMWPIGRVAMPDDELYLQDWFALESKSIFNNLELTMGELRHLAELYNVCPYNPPQATIDPPHYHDFHSGGGETMFTITNTGTVPITGLRANATTVPTPWAPWNEFRISSQPSPASLMPGESATVWVEAVHDGGGDIEGTLRVTGNGGLELLVELSLTCGSWRAESEYMITSDDTPDVPPENAYTQSDSDHYPIDDENGDNELSPTEDDPIEIGNQNEQPHYPTDNGYTIYHNHDNR